MLLVILLLFPCACRKKPAPTQPVEPPAARKQRLKQELVKRQSAVAVTAPAPTLRRYKECAADAKKACELGLSEGCARARQMGRLAR